LEMDFSERNQGKNAMVMISIREAVYDPLEARAISARKPDARVILR
jgi:hypothetical protein